MNINETKQLTNALSRLCAYDNIQKQKAEAMRREEAFKVEQDHIAKEQEMSLWDRVVSAIMDFFKVKEPIPVKVETRSELN